MTGGSHRESGSRTPNSHRGRKNSVWTSPGNFLSSSSKLGAAREVTSSPLTEVRLTAPCGDWTKSSHCRVDGCARRIVSPVAASSSN